MVNIVLQKVSNDKIAVYTDFSNRLQYTFLISMIFDVIHMTFGMAYPIFD